jgi:hypothetical protein
MAHGISNYKRRGRCCIQFSHQISVQNWHVTNLVSKEVTETKQTRRWMKRYASLSLALLMGLLGDLEPGLIDPQNKDELKNAEPKHLFWVLLFLKTYCTEPVLRRVVGGVDGGTFRVWTWKFVKEVSDLKPRDPLMLAGTMQQSSKKTFD